MNNEKRNQLIPTIARTSPVLFIILLLINFIVSPSVNSFYLFIVYILVNLSNWFIKNAIVKPIYKLTGKTKLPILGIGARPYGASSCHFTLDGKPATTFGMPSGHSQLAWFISTYILCKIISNWKNNDNDTRSNPKETVITIFSYLWLIASSIIILSIAFYISYSRVYIEGCHTKQQVILGGILGVACGFITYYFENDVINLFK